jgi:DNA-binding transcriptional LysR family regulator
MIQAALDGAGIAYVPHDLAAQHIATQATGTATCRLVSLISGILSLLPGPTASSGGVYAGGRRAALAPQGVMSAALWLRAS